jgi:hypothetical protein
MYSTEHIKNISQDAIARAQSAVSDVSHAIISAEERLRFKLKTLSARTSQVLLLQKKKHPIRKKSAPVVIPSSRNSPIRSQISAR